MVSRIEGEFLKLALEIGLAETIVWTLRDIDRAMAQLPSDQGTRYRQRLEEQRQSLRNPTLRTTAALVVSICAREPALTPTIRRAFRDLVGVHPELSWFFTQLPPEADAAAPLRRAS